MPSESAVTGLMLALLAMAAARVVLAGEVEQLAVLPVQDLAQLERSEVDYLSDVVRGAATNADPTGGTLVPHKKVIKAAGKKASACDESCAARVGRKTGADRVLLCEVRRLGDELRATAKLLTREGALIAMQRASGADAAALEGELERAVAALFRPPEATPAAPVLPLTAPPGVAVEGDYYGELIVTATGTKEGSPTQEPMSVKADVHINGRLVGATPLTEGLPPGTYLIEVKSKGRLLHSQQLDVVAGRSYRVEAKAIIPLTAAELAAADEARAKAVAEQQAALAAKWDRIRSEWEAEDETVRAQRKPYQIGGTALLIGGLGLAVSGIALEVRARREDESVFRYYDKWQAATDPDEIYGYEDRMEEAQRARDVSHALGITFLAVGGASLVTSFVLYGLMPAKLEEPQHPPALDLVGQLSLELTPLICPNVAGLSIGGRF